jgi:hypothetical protein
MTAEAIRLAGTAMAPEEIEIGLASIHALLDNFEWNRSRVEDPARTAQTIGAIIQALMDHDRPPRSSTKPPRGVG